MKQLEIWEKISSKKQLVELFETGEIDPLEFIMFGIKKLNWGIVVIDDDEQKDIDNFSGMLIGPQAFLDEMSNKPKKI